MEPKVQKVQVVVIGQDPHQGPVLLRLQTNEKSGSFWQNITGSVEADESFFAAAKRELLEETGLQQNKHALWFELKSEWRFTDRRRNDVIEKCFLFYYQHELPPIQLSGEHIAFEWKIISDITAKNFKYESNFETFKEALIHV